MRRTAWILPLIGVCFFLVTVLWLLPGRVAERIDGDAIAYNNGGLSLLTEGMYSFDMVHPLYDREPGMSVFIAGVYAVFGVGNVAAVYLVQAALYLAAVALFLREIAHHVSQRAVAITFGFFMIVPPVYHMVLSLDRELLTLVFFMGFVTCLLAYRRIPRAWLLVPAGLFLGAIGLTHSPFIVLPLFLLPLFLLWRMRLSHVVLLLLLELLVLFPWGLRNTLAKGRPCLTGCYRSATMWYVRGEQAEHIHGLMPLRCLWAEYISRDWSSVSPQCSLNAVKNARWHDGRPLTEADLPAGASGRQKILRNFPSYLWFSLFEILELHIPFVNGWGFQYNVLTVAVTLVLYAGCFASLRRLFTDRTFWLLLAIMTYTVLVFILTDATPRYLMPVIFCYITLAGVGYDRMLPYLSHALPQHHHPGL